MRYKPEHKEATHQRIVESASREFRAHGFDGVGIAKLMGGLNLTHGGFYAHFEGKEALESEALTFALDQTFDEMVTALESGGLPALLDYYLSDRHQEHPEVGCPLPTLAADVARRSPQSRETFTRELNRVFDRVAAHLPGPTSPEKSARVAFLFATLSGAVSLARAVADPVLNQSLRDTTRAQMLQLFPEEVS